jgi:hypothetical protein
MKGDFKLIKANKINILCFAFLVLDYSIIQLLAKEVINASLATFDLNLGLYGLQIPRRISYFG